MRIIQSTRKHGVADADIIHAVQHSICGILREPEIDRHSPMTIYVGPARNGALLEVGVIYTERDPEGLIVHAMKHRQHKYPLR